MELSAGSRVGPHEITGPLGRGGMGVVYGARDLKLGRPVAIKVLRSEFSSDPERLRRFETEARAASALNHPNIVTIYDIGRLDDKTPFIVMELVEGETLRQVFASGPLPLRDLFRLAAQIADGLAKAHEAGIVHRDLKPENLMITTDGFVKIMDFGLAKLLLPSIVDSDVATLEQGGTASGVMLGTVSYMSPEQASGRRVELFSDQFSLGSILYEMATGRRPFFRESPVQTLSAIIESEPVSLARLKPELPASLLSIVERLLAKEPKNRYASTRNLALDLQNLRDGGGQPETPARTCPHCGKSVPLESVFCGRCGRRLPDATEAAPRSVALSSSSSGSLVEGERRQATILSSALAGYSALVEQLEPGDLESLIEKVKGVARETVEGHGGVVHRSDGGEMLALFGIPTSHEDDFLRAVQAALALHTRVEDLSADLEKRRGQSIRLQTGVDTGRVVTQSLGEGGFEIAGDPLQLANRLSALAEPGEVLISLETQRLIAPFMETEEGEPVRVKGRSHSLRTFRVTGESGVLTRLEAAERFGLTPYTGREKESALLEDCLKKALSGEGQFVTVVGEAGVGKSRLLHEFRRSLEREDVALLQGRCSSFGENIPYFPFIATLKNALHLESEVSAPGLLASALAGIRAIGQGLEDYVPLYLYLLSISSEEYPLPRHLEGPDLKAALLEALSALFTVSAGARPMVILLEDWHRADDASQEALHHLAGLIGAHRLLIVVTYRPERSFDWGNLDHHTSVHLSLLETSSSFRLIRWVIGAEHLPEGLERLVHARTGGNPFFTEEVCHSLKETGILQLEQGQAALTRSIDELHLPTSVQAVVRSRLDRLDRESQAVLRHASVIGLEFSRKVLERTLPRGSPLSASLETLKALGLVQQTRVLPEATYRFKHALTQEVAYDGLILHQRKLLHEAVGVAVEDLYSNRLEEQLDLLAQHFSRAESWQKAVHYGRAAAERAQRLSQFTEALDRLEKVRGWLMKLPDDAARGEALVDLLLREERVCETLGARDRQERIVGELLERLGPHGDPARLAEVYRRQGELLTLVGRSEEAERVLIKALQTSRERSDLVGERNALRSMGFLRWHQGRFQEAVEAAEQALVIDRRRNDLEAVTQDLHNLGVVLRKLGEYPRVLRCFEEALELSERTQNMVMQQAALGYIGLVYQDIGDNGKAMSHFLLVEEFCRKHRMPVERCFWLSDMAAAFLKQGNVEKSIEQYEAVVEVSRSISYAEGLVVALSSLGQLLISLGRPNEALPYLLEAIEVFGRMQERGNEADLLAKVAGIYEQQERYVEAAAAWGKAWALRRPMPDARAQLEPLEGLARSLRRQGDIEGALSRYEEVLQTARELGDRRREGDIRNTLGILEWSRANYGQALTHYEIARTIYQELDDPVQLGLIWNSIGVTLKSLDRLDEAKKALQEAVRINRKTGEQLLEGHSLAALGDLSREAGSLEEALAQYAASLEMRRAIGDRKGEGWMLYRLAQVNAAQGSKELALDLSAQASAIAGECGDSKLQEACRDLRPTEGEGNDA